MANEAAEKHQRKQAAFRHLGDVRVQLAVELGRKVLSLGEARALGVDDCIELDKLAGEAFDMTANSYPFAEGEIVVMADQKAYRITRIRSSVGGR